MEYRSDMDYSNHKYFGLRATSGNERKAKKSDYCPCVVDAGIRRFR
jgi:hypothetical protein